MPAWIGSVHVLGKLQATERRKMLFVEQREMPLKNARQLISSLPKEEGGSHCESRSSAAWEPGTRSEEEAR
jgi:hypothetical protein